MEVLMVMVMMTVTVCSDMRLKKAQQPAPICIHFMASSLTCAYYTVGVIAIL